MATSSAPSEIINVHSVNILQKLFLDEETADVYFTFFFENITIRMPAHKLILATGSSVFKKMFFGSVPEEGDIPIVDASVEAFKEFLSIFYLNKVSISSEHVSSLMNLAEKYDVADVFIVCDEFLKKQYPSDICIAYEAAFKFHRSELQEFCEKKIQENSQAVFDANDFDHSKYDYSLDVLKWIFELEFSPCDPIKVFSACIAYAENTCKVKQLDTTMENMKAQLGDCFYSIPFYLMENHQIKLCLKNYPDLFPGEEFWELVDLQCGNNLTNLKKFKYKRFFIPKFVGQEDTVQRCDTIRAKENIEFSPEKPIRVVAIKPFSTLNPEYTPFEKYTVTMDIFEKNGSNDMHSTQKFYLHKKNYSFTPPIVKLIKPIYCKANKQYEIRFTFDNTTSRGTKYAYIDVSTIKARDNRSYEESIVAFLCYDFEEEEQ